MRRAVLLATVLLAAVPGTAAAAAPVRAGTEARLRAAWGDPRVRAIELTADITLQGCRAGDPVREARRSILLDGNGHTIRQTCFEKRVLRQDGTGLVRLESVTLTRGGSDGPGAAVTTRGAIEIVDSRITRNLAEEPGGGVFAGRSATIIRSVITGNLANDDGGGVYALRGGVRVFDSVISGNIVDGSGGAIGSTGDILVVRSHLDGNTTDGDGGAIYADQRGDVTIIDSSVDGSTADGPGGAVFTVDGDVTVIGSTLNGNRADDRGGAIAGEGDVTIVDSTIARNAAVAHVGGGVWARGDLDVIASTIVDNYAEGQGGGISAAGIIRLSFVTILDNFAPVGANLGAGQGLVAFASIIGPARAQPGLGEGQPTTTSCRTAAGRSLGFNLVTDGSCGLGTADDMVGGLPLLAPMADNGGGKETRLPLHGSAARDRVPPAACVAGEFAGVLAIAAALAGRAMDPPHDERGVARPRGAPCDAGAVETG